MLVVYCIIYDIIVFENLRFHHSTCRREASPLWRAFLKRCVFGDRCSHRISVRGRPNRWKKSPFSNKNGYVLTGSLGLFTWRWGPQIGEVTCGGSPHLSCKRDQIKMRDYMDRRVTPPERVTSSTWGPHLHVNRPLDWQNNNSVRASSFLHISSPSLHDRLRRGKYLISRFVEDVNTRRRLSFYFPELRNSLLEFNSRKSCQKVVELIV